MIFGVPFSIILALTVLAVLVLTLLIPRVRLALTIAFSVLFRHERALPQLIGLYKGRVFADELNYELLLENGDMLLTKDGGLMGGFTFHGQDVETMSVEEREALATRLNTTFQQFGSDHTVHIEAIRIPSTEYPDSVFPNRVATLIDEERRKKYEKEGEHFETLYFFFVKQKLEAVTAQRVQEWLDGRDETFNSDSYMQHQIQVFDDLLNNVEDSVVDHLNIRRMGGQEVLKYGKPCMYSELLQAINMCIMQQTHPLEVPSESVPFLDLLLGGNEMLKGMPPKLNDDFIGVIAVDGFPSRTFANMLYQLDQMPLRYRWSTRFLFLDTQDALAEIKREKRYWDQKKIPFLDALFKKSRPDKVNQDAVDMSSDTQTALKETESGMIRYGMFSSNFIVHAEDKIVLKDACRYIKKMVNDNHFNARVETYNTLDAYFGSLPGDTAHNLRAPMLHSLHLAHILPTAAIWAGESNNPCPLYEQPAPPLIFCETKNRTPFRLSLHSSDVGHTLVCGPTGKGKSTLLAVLIAQHLRYKDAQVIIFDKGQSLMPVTLGLGGRHYQIRPGHPDSQKFTPLARVDQPAEKEWAANWIENIIIYNTQEEAVTPIQRRRIREALTELSQEPPEQRTLTNYYAYVQDEGIKEIIKLYTRDEDSPGSILDGNDETIEVGQVTCFEMQEVLGLRDNFKYPIIEYLFRIEERALHSSKPTLNILDETGFYLKNKKFREQIGDWLVSRRKNNEAVVLSLQTITQAITDDDIATLAVIHESCPTRIFLPNKGAKDEISSEFYRKVGLNQQQILLLTLMREKSEYMLIKPEGRRLFQLALGDYTLAYAGVKSEDFPTIQKLHDEHGDGWTIEWEKYLKQRNEKEGQAKEEVMQRAPQEQQMVTTVN